MGNDISLSAPARTLALVEGAKRMLTEARTLGDVKEVIDKAEALRVYLKQQGDAFDAQQVAAEISLRAKRRAGEILKQTEMQRPGTYKALQRVRLCPSLREIGVTYINSSRWQRLAGLDDEAFERYIEQTKRSGRELTTAGALKLAKQHEARKTVAATDAEPETGIVHSLAELVAGGRKFKTIYADPPWRYGNQATRASTDNHYETMSVDEICSEPVRELVADNAHLHLWTTNAFLYDAFRVIEAWGFTYKSCFVWVKPRLGIGNYWRVSHEFLLFGLRGTLPFVKRDEPSWGEYDRTAHSAKPDAIRVKVERVSPGPYLEMYGRVFRPGAPWTVYGNQVSRLMF